MNNNQKIADKVRELIVPAESTLWFLKDFLDKVSWKDRKYFDTLKSLAILAELKTLLGYKEDIQEGKLPQIKMKFDE